MTRDPSKPPETFVSYVERRLPAVMRAARQFGGDERLADDLAREVFVAVAARWDRLTATDTKRGEAAGAAADRLLHRAYRHGARDLATDRRDVADLVLVVEPWPPQPRSALAGTLSAADEAALFWARAYRTGRRRLLIAGGLGVLGLALFLGRPRAAEKPSVDAPTTRPSRLPAGIDVLGPLIDQRRLPVRVTAIPRDLDLRPEATIGVLGDRMAGRALALFQDYRSGPLLVLGPDGGLRSFNRQRITDPQRQLRSPAVLSADGNHAAFPVGDRIDVVDMLTGTARRLPGFGGAPPIWLDTTHLLAGSRDQGLIYDIRTAVGAEVPASADDLAVPGVQDAPLTPGDYAGRMTLLLAPDRAATGSARLLSFTPGFTRQTSTTLVGDLAGWIGRWRGVGFGGADGLVARCCEVDQDLPAGMGRVTTGIAVIRVRTGEVLRLLLDTTLTDSTQTELLGWLDSRTVLLATGTTYVLLLLAWHTETGALELVSAADRGARVAVAALS